VGNQAREDNNTYCQHGDHRRQRTRFIDDLPSDSTENHDHSGSGVIRYIQQKTTNAGNTRYEPAAYQKDRVASSGAG
jgi:hypothetical protein